MEIVGGKSSVNYPACSAPVPDVTQDNSGITARPGSSDEVVGRSGQSFGAVNGQSLHMCSPREGTLTFDPSMHYKITQAYPGIIERPRSSTG